MSYGSNKQNAPQNTSKHKGFAEAVHKGTSCDTNNKGSSDQTQAKCIPSNSTCSYKQMENQRNCEVLQTRFFTTIIVIQAMEAFKSLKKKQSQHLE